MNHRQRQQGLALGVLVSRIEGLERRLVAAEARERELREHVDSLSRSLAKAWRRIEVLDRPGVRIAAPQMPAPARPRRRLPASEAAELIGCDTRTVRRLVESGRLRGSALDLGASRKFWTVEAADVERLLSDGSPAAPAAPDGAFPGVPRARNGG